MCPPNNEWQVMSSSRFGNMGQTHKVVVIKHTFTTMLGDHSSAMNRARVLFQRRPVAIGHNEHGDHIYCGHGLGFDKVIHINCFRPAEVGCPCLNSLSSYKYEKLLFEAYCVESFRR